MTLATNGQVAAPSHESNLIEFRMPSLLRKKEKF
jgi:hypothetical protein